MLGPGNSWTVCILTSRRSARLMIDRAGGVQAINRYPEDGESTATNACMIGVPASLRFEACRGPADRGEWVHLRFQTAG